MFWVIGIVTAWFLPACFILWRFGPADDANPSIFERLFFALGCLLWPVLGAIAVISIAWAKVQKRKTRSDRASGRIDTKAGLFSRDF
jgi:hypothetical protein